MAGCAPGAHGPVHPDRPCGSADKRTNAGWRRRAAGQRRSRVAPLQAVQGDRGAVHPGGNGILLAEEHQGAAIGGEARRERAAQGAGQARGARAGGGGRPGLRPGHGLQAARPVEAEDYACTRGSGVR